MTTTTQIAPGGQIEKDPYDKVVSIFDWDEHLEEGEELLTSGEFTVSSVTEPVEAVPWLEIDSVILLSGNRSVLLRMKAGTPNHVYNVAHRVQWGTEPDQQRERSFDVWVHD